MIRACRPWGGAAAVAALAVALVAGPAVASASGASPATVALTPAGLADPDAPTAVPTYDPALDVERGGVGAAGATATTWSLVPASADGPDGRVSLRHDVDPGATLTEHVALTNHTDAPVTFALAAGDGVVTAAGDFDLPPTGTAATAAGTWVDVVGRVEVGPRATVVVPVTVAVPPDARPGDHPAGLVASLATPVDGDGARVTLDSRVGVRLHLRVAGDVVAALAVDDVAARYVPSWNPFAPGRVEVTYVLRNSGDVRLGARARMAADPWLGASWDVEDTPVREVLPGGSAARSITLDDVWPLGRATLDVAAVAAAVGDDVPVDATVRGATATVWTLPFLHVALAGVVVAVVLGLRWSRRRAAARLQAAVARARAEVPAPA